MLFKLKRKKFLCTAKISETLKGFKQQQPTMQKLFYLSTCNTCQRIIKEMDLPSDVMLQDIKTEALTAEQLEYMKRLSGSYESLFSKRARLYKDLGLKDSSLSEDDYKNYILKHYTFLKRPVLIYDNKIFVGNSKKVVASAKQALHG